MYIYCISYLAVILILAIIDKMYYEKCLVNRSEQLANNYLRFNKIFKYIVAIGLAIGLVILCIP